MTDRKIEMHWVCSSCRARNLGRHKKCQHCGDPKDASEPWIMPSDTRAAPTVTDPALLRQANAGADWQCSFCKSHQRRLDGACANCGAAQSEGAPLSPAARVIGPPASRRSKLWYAVPFAALASIAGCCALAIWARPDPPPRELHKPIVIAADVSGARWRRVVHIERYRVVDEEGFDRPSDAMDVVSHGQRHHHDEQILDHYETETYQEQVPYQESETYQEQEQCGEDCTDLPQHCSETCTPDENGFATCTTSCTGGGRSCTPRYCSVTRTRQVTRYRSETRTRQVPRYRTEPRYAEHFAWRAWRWRHDRDVESAGDASEAPRWPTDAELAPPVALAQGEQERFAREERYEVELVHAGRTYRITPATLAEFERVSAHRRWYLDDPSRGVRLLKPVLEPRPR